MTLRVRAALPADAATIARFNVDMARETEGLELDPGLVERGVAEGIADPVKARYLIAELEGSSVGCLMLSREWSDWRCGWIDWIQSVFVAAEARGRGVYRAMHEFVLEQARRDPQTRAVRLYVVEANTGARSTYERCGMHRTDYLLYEQAL